MNYMMELNFIKRKHEGTKSKCETAVMTQVREEMCQIPTKAVIG